MNELIINATGLNYYFNKNQKTLDNINLAVIKGSVYGFLGPNGAGKTTTLKLLLGLLKPQDGSIKIFDDDITESRISILARVGSLIEQPSLYSHLTAKENLEVYRKIHSSSKSRITEVLHAVGLENTGGKRTKQFSLGMKQRLSIAIALLHHPELLILDEPTNGLDPNGIIETRELIKVLNSEHGVTIIVSSHILAEIERMATHVGIIHKGKMLFEGTLRELQQMKTRQSYLQIETSDNYKASQLLKIGTAEEKNGLLTIPYESKEATSEINLLLVKNNIAVYMLQPQQSDLEQLFIDITSEN